MRSLDESIDSGFEMKGGSCNFPLRVADNNENSLADSNNAGEQSGGCLSEQIESPRDLDDISFSLYKIQADEGNYMPELRLEKHALIEEEK
jgi:hypothetical protein